AAPATGTTAERTAAGPAVPAAAQSDLHAGVQASTLAPRQTGLSASKRASMQEHESSERAGPVAGGRSAPGPPGARAPPEVADDIWESLETPATITNSFRYTDAELSALTDVLYQIGKQQGARLTKQDVARLGLNVVLDDYWRRGSASMLGQL